MPRAGRIWDRVDLSCLQFFAQARLTDRPDSGAQRVHLTSRFQRLPGSPHSQFSALTRLAGHAVTPGGQDFEAYRFDGRPGPGGAQARWARRKSTIRMCWTRGRSWERGNIISIGLYLFRASSGALSMLGVKPSQQPWPCQSPVALLLVL